MNKDHPKSGDEYRKLAEAASEDIEGRSISNRGPLLKKQKALSDMADNQDWLDGKPRKKTRASKAADLARDVIDRVDDKAATLDERADRKRQLVKGPPEFRETRVDQLKKR